MTTTVHERPTDPTAVAAQQRAARLTGLALAGATALTLATAALVEGADRPGARVVLGACLLAVAGLELVVGWGLHTLLRRGARSSAYAALLSRAGYAVLLAASAARLLWPGGDGIAGLRADWSLALGVLGVHLLVASVALWHARGAPGAVVAATAGAGTASLLGPALGGLTLPDVLPGAGPLVPGALGALVLLAWLLGTGTVPAPARRSSYPANRSSALGSGAHSDPQRGR